MSPMLKNCALALLLTSVIQAQTPTHQAMEGAASPRISALRKSVQVARGDAESAFWQETQNAGTPLVEAIPGDSAHSFVTFVWRGDSTTRNVAIFDGVAGFDAKDRMAQVPRTNVWYKTYKVRNDARFAYNLSPNDSLESFDNIKDDAAMEKRLAMLRIDPLNPRRCPATFGALSAHASYVELPLAPPQPWNAMRAGVPRGSVQTTTFRSRILKNQRKLWIYTPYEFSNSRERYPLLVLFDGDRNVKWIPAILDNLIAQKKIAPMVALLIDNPSSAARKLELPCYPAFADFLATELVPWARQHSHATLDAAHTIAAGSSYGGLAGVFAGLRHPEVFGNVISLSGSFWWKPEGADEAEWLTRQIAHSPKLPLSFYLEVGLMEEYPNQIDSNRRMRDALQSRGYRNGYAEYDGGHSFLNWSGGAANGLIFLMGSH